MGADQAFLIHVKAAAQRTCTIGCSLRAEEKQHGDVNYLICLDALHEAYRDLEQARIECREAAHALATIRETLDQVLELAYQQQSFGPLNKLFDEEEAALAVYEQSVAKVRELEGRWSAVSLALDCEKERVMAGRLPSDRMEGVIHLRWK
jgi:hypothetical protein